MIESLRRWRPQDLRRRAEGMSREERLEVAERAFAIARVNVMWMRRHLVIFVLLWAMFNIGAVLDLAGDRHRLIFIVAAWVGAVIAAGSLLGSDNRLKWWLTAAAIACPVLGGLIFWAMR